MLMVQMCVPDQEFLGWNVSNERSQAVGLTEPGTNDGPKYSSLTENTRYAHCPQTWLVGKPNLFHLPCTNAG